MLTAVDFFTVPTATFRILYVFIVLNERHLRRLLEEYLDYYHRSRTHLLLNKDPPTSRAVQSQEEGRIVAFPVLGGLHHRYTRLAA